MKYCSIFHGIVISRYVFKNSFKTEKQRPAFSDMWKSIPLFLKVPRFHLIIQIRLALRWRWARTINGINGINGISQSVSTVRYKRAWLLHVTFVLNTCCYSQWDSTAVLISQSEGCVVKEMSPLRAVVDSDILQITALIYEFVTSVSQGWPIYVHSLVSVGPYLSLLGTVRLIRSDDYV